MAWTLEEGRLFGKQASLSQAEVRHLQISKEQGI